MPLEDRNSDYGGIPYHTVVRWLTLGKVLGPKNASPTVFEYEREK